jgi:PIN domain nuclease of toxin-antitoxin system
LKLLLDTQVYLWFLADSRRLSREARRVLDRAEEVFVSAASVWESAIKVSIGKLRLDVRELVTHIEASGFRALPVTAEHAARVALLPTHHRDPFDRLLVAQAIHETMRLLTADATLVRYSELIVAID